MAIDTPRSFVWYYDENYEIFCDFDFLTIRLSLRLQCINLHPMVDNLFCTTDISVLCPDNETTRTAISGMISPDGLMLVPSMVSQKTLDMLHDH